MELLTIPPILNFLKLYLCTYDNHSTGSSTMMKPPTPTLSMVYVSLALHAMTVGTSLMVGQVENCTNRYFYEVRVYVCDLLVNFT